MSLVWFSDDGTTNTVALPQPRDLFAVTALRDLEVLLSHPLELTPILEELEEEWGEEIESLGPDMAHEEEFSGRAPVGELVTGSLRSLGELRSKLSDIPWRWRMEAIEAVWDLAESGDEG